MTAIVFLSLLAFRSVPDWWMAQWHHVTWSNADDRLSVYIYTALIVGLMLLSFVSCLLFYQVVINSARNLHDSMALSVLKAPVLFFDTNPAGRILNRFSKDVGFMDDSLLVLFQETFQQVFMLALSVLVPAMANYWVLLAGIPLVLLSVYCGRYCIRVSREVARLDAINRSHVYTRFPLTLEGLVTIRTYEKQRNFVQEFYRSATVFKFLFPKLNKSSTVRLSSIVYITKSHAL